jgi:hypothetical protein
VGFCGIHNASKEEGASLSHYKRDKTMGSSDWYVWVVGGFGAFVFDVTMNHAKVFQMLTGLVRSAGF